MGKLNTAMRTFLCDRERFADLFNGVFFQGKPVIRADRLLEASETYSDITENPLDRTRDLKMVTDDGETLRILLSTPAERLCGITRQDRLAPVYTLCLYHGEEHWDGPVSLRDMMDFGADREDMGRFFADYPITLFCINEHDNFHMFHTELREVFLS